MKRVLIVIVAGLFTGFVLMRVSSNPLVLNKKASTTNPTPQVSNSLIPPIDIDHPDVSFFGMTYTFKGVVSKFKQSGNIYKIELKNNISPMPSLSTNNSTVVVSRIDREDSPADITDVKEGDKVLLAALYDVKRKVWRLNRIIVDNTSIRSQPTP